MELRDYVRVLRRGWLLILACLVLGGLLAATVTWRATKMYAATVTLVVSTADSGMDNATAYQGGLLSQQRVKSYATLVASERVAAAALARLGLDQGPMAVDPADLRARIQTAPVPDTVLLRVSVRDTDPARARSLADAIGDVFAADVAQIEAPSPDEAPPVRVNVWEPAKLPTSPVSPQPVRDFAFGLLLGLLAGVGAALVRHRLDTTLTGERDAIAITDRPLLGSIIYETDANRRPLIIHTSPHSPRAEAFRQLRTNLRFVDVGGGPRSILVTSSVPAEGKSTTTCNLAITLAQSGARVCLVEGDLRRPSFGDYLGVETGAGLTSVLIGAADLDDVLQPWGVGRVGGGHIDVLPSGPIPPNPSELLGSHSMADLLDLLGSRYDIVLIDAPPLLPVTDAAVLAGRVGGTLLVARVGRTQRDQLRKAIESLRTVEARVLGTVLNMVPTKGPSSYGYGGYYGFGPGRTGGRHARPGSRAAGTLGTMPTAAPVRPAAPTRAQPMEGADAESTEPVRLIAQRTPEHDQAAGAREK
ncbi:MAG: polysaccharide biosynthesis tyrosine autokinase [Frankia sp.]|nr:polysaccharide biosynthesis tyrosine autokinase [Frankia sp.]